VAAVDREDFREHGAVIEEGDRDLRLGRPAARADEVVGQVHRARRERDEERVGDVRRRAVGVDDDEVPQAERGVEHVDISRQLLVVDAHDAERALPREVRLVASRLLR